MSGSIQIGVPFGEYRLWHGLSMSSLKEIKHSPQNYIYRRSNPRKSKAMALGTAAHCAVLEPARFADEYVVWNRVVDSGKSAPRSGQYWEKFCQENEGKAILTPLEYADATNIANAIRADDVAMKYLAHGDPEVALQWLCDGHARKARPDWITEIDARPCLVGLKTARDCRPFKFGNECARLLYHASWAWYFDGYEIITGKEPIMIEIAVESKAPHSVVVYVIPEEVIQRGREVYRELLERLELCERENYWPGPGDSVEQMLSLPEWAYAAADNDLSDLDVEV